MRKAAPIVIVLLLMLTTANLSSANPVVETKVAVDGEAQGRTYNGAGALSAGASSRLLVDYPEPQRSQVLDYLFKPGHGANVQLLKIEIGGDTNSTDGTEPSHERAPGAVDCGRGYEWWLAKEAKRRNPDIRLAALAWGTPGWVGQGKQTVWTDQFIDYQLSWMRCAESHGLAIDYLGGWNEKDNNPNWYVRFRKALDAHGYQDVKVVGDDSFNWDVVKDMEKNPEFAKAVDVVGQHYTCGYLQPHTECPSPKQARDLGKPLWASEQGSHRYDTGAAALARSTNRGYTDGRVTGNINWSLVWSAYAGLPFAGAGLMLANEPWSGHYSVGPSVWAMAQTTQFTKPGWRYLNSGSHRIPGGSVVSLREPKGPNWTSIVETLNAQSPQRVSVNVSGGLSSAPVHIRSTKPSSTNSEDWFADEGTLRPQHGKLSFTAEPGTVYSLSTMGGQGKATVTSPPSQSWPLPYAENFENYRTDEMPRYFSDLGGSFATAPCTGRPGQCLRQAVDQQPVQWIDWHNAPRTVVGDPGWTDYRASVDARLATAGTVDIGARVGNNGTSGYHLRLSADGKWELVTIAADGSSKTLKSGDIGSGRGWHRLELGPHGGWITASIDDKQVAALTDQHYFVGQASIGVNGWQHAEFDNFDVKPAGA